MQRLKIVLLVTSHGQNGAVLLTVCKERAKEGARLVDGNDVGLDESEMRIAHLAELELVHKRRQCQCRADEGRVVTDHA